MKKNILKIMLLMTFMFIGINGVSASDAIATCTYTVKDNTNSYIYLTIDIFKDSIEKNYESENSSSFVNYENWTNDESDDFDALFLDRAFTDGNLNSTCPSLSYTIDGTTYIFDALGVANGTSSTEVSGVINIKDTDVDTHEIEIIEYCTKTLSIKGTNQAFRMTFYNEEGINMLKVYSTTDGTFAAAEVGSEYNTGLKFSDYMFTVRSADINKYYSTSCNSYSMYLELTDTFVDDDRREIKITSVKPSDESNAGTTTEYDDTNTTDGTDEDYTPATVACGDVSDIPAALPVFTSNLITLIKIITPVILIIMGMLDFFRASTSNDDKAMKESTGRFIKRIVAAIVVFMSFTILQLVISLFGDTRMLAVVNLFINGDCSMVTTAKEDCVTEGIEICANKYDSSGTTTTGIYKYEKCIDEVRTACATNGTTEACYKCSSNDDLTVWANSNPGMTPACVGGYSLDLSLDEETCRTNNYTYACYQCNGTGELAWKYSTGADSACTSGYHIRPDITTEAACK